MRDPFDEILYDLIDDQNFQWQTLTRKERTGTRSFLVRAKEAKEQAKAA